MNATRFDAAVRSLIGRAQSRRGLTRALPGLALAAALTRWGVDDPQAGKRKKRKNTPKANRFGCRNVGVECASASQCCSGICEGSGGKGKNGKRRKKRCRAHDTGGCKAAQDSCSTSTDFECVTTTGEDGFCHLTTGNAPYCALDAIDSECTKDEDCFELCGPLAACNVCAEPGQAEFRFCGGPSRCEGFARP